MSDIFDRNPVTIAELCYHLAVFGAIVAGLFKLY